MIVMTLALIAISASALAEISRVASAQRAYDELRFGDVLSEVAIARRDGGLSAADDIELTRLEAYTYAVFGDAARSRDVFRRLLTLQPKFAPENVSPKIRAAIEDARSSPTAAPASLPPPPETKPAAARSTRSRWLWGGVALAALAAGVGVVFLVARDGSGDGSANLGTLELP